MAEAVGLTSAIVTLVTIAHSSCQELYSKFDGLRNAPKHIMAVSSDLQDFYLVLGSIQALLDDEDFAAGLVQHAQSVNLCKVLKDCVAVFREFRTIVSEYQASNKYSAIGTWQRMEWTFKESEIKALRSDLNGCKVTLNLAISVANYYNVHATPASTARIEEDMNAHLQELEKLPGILEHLEDLKATQLPQATPHGELDRAGIKIDYSFALRHYVDSAASIRSNINTPSTPSFQVSALETSSSQLTSKFYTAPMSQSSNGEARQTSRKCTQILVRNVGPHKTMALQVVPDQTIRMIKSLVCERIGLENAEFDLLYSGRVLYSVDNSIDGYRIPHDATLTGISFRPNHSPPALCAKRGSCIYIRTTSGKEVDLHVEPDTLMREVKEMCAVRLAIPCPKDIQLFYNRQQFEDDRPLGEYNIIDGAVMYMALGSCYHRRIDKLIWTLPPAREVVLLEEGEPQREYKAPPRNSEVKKVARQVLSFWKRRERRQSLAIIHELPSARA